MSEKTEKPTHKRLADARKKGDVAHAKDASKALLIWACAGYLLFSASQLTDAMLFLIEWAGTHANGPFLDVLAAFLRLAVREVGLALLPWMVIVIVLSIFGELLTAGPVFAPEKMKFNFQKLDVVANVKNMFSSRNLVEALKSLVKVVALTGIVWKLVHDNLGTLMLLAGSGIQPVTTGFGLLIKSLLLTTAFVFTVIAGFDMLIQRRLFARQQMMTKDEVKREHKESDGAPEIKRERRKLHREIVQGGGGGKRKPSVVVTNPTHLAVALLYEHGETRLPLVVAKGAGLQAQAIVRDARAEGIPIIQHIPLARALVAQVEVDDPVPEHLFELVIDVLKAVKDVAPTERPRS
jgi:type III secretion protein U